MFSHGIIAGLLFAVVGRMVYARTHTRDAERTRRQCTSRVSFPSPHSPSSSPAWLQSACPDSADSSQSWIILIGAWHAFPVLAILAGLGILVGIAFIWRALQKAFFGEPSPASPPHAALPPISAAERVGAAILIAATVIIGLYPRFLLDLILPALNSPLFDGLRNGGWR